MAGYEQAADTGFCRRGEERSRWMSGLGDVNFNLFIYYKGDANILQWNTKEEKHGPGAKARFFELDLQRAQ